MSGSTGPLQWRYIVLLLSMTSALTWATAVQAGGALGDEPCDGMWADGRQPGATLPGHSQAGDVLPQAADLLRVLEGRTYYLLEDNFTCRANTPERPRIKSWKNKLAFTRGQVLVWHTLCNDSPIVMDFAEPAFGFATDLSSLTYQHETYTYYAQPPQLCEQGQWCPVETPQEPHTPGRENPTHEGTQDTHKARE